ncbi:hypothetical protein [Aliikangiella coralliicola]|uniref:Porin n=1 Tax=Aliikangiella coralliicola TaxID=2592383 RepID=A0A545UF69_9GAMM|nr:hypothetical protein [Aliikangiella coralliicola]TQV88122.1 hypothetical protein FLL46_06235 [Aliikangiella coralliicola]
MTIWAQSYLNKIATFKKDKTLAKPGSLLISAGILLFSSTAWSGAWVPEVGSGYSKFAFSDYKADDFFGDNATSVDFSGQNYSYYGEYGFTKDFAIYGTLLYQDLEQINNAGVASESSGFGDTEIGIRYQWQAQPFVVSTSFLVKLPFLYDENDALPRGNGQEDYELRILFGRSLNEYGYLGFEAGYRLRTGAPSDEYRYLFEYGFSVSDNFYLRTKVDTTISANNADTVSNNSNLSITPEFDLTKLELTAGWTLGDAKSSKEKWGVEITYRQDLDGENTLEGDGFEIGLTRVF